MDEVKFSRRRRGKGTEVQMNDLTRPISLTFSSQQDTAFRYASVVYTFSHV